MSEVSLKRKNFYVEMIIIADFWEECTKYRIIFLQKEKEVAGYVFFNVYALYDTQKPLQLIHKMY
jgi:hypothetical protein